MAKKKRQALNQVSPYPIDECVQRLRAFMSGKYGNPQFYKFQLDRMTQDRYTFKLSRTVYERYGYGKSYHPILSGRLTSTGNDRTEVLYPPPGDKWFARVTPAFVVLGFTFGVLIFLANANLPPHYVVMILFLLIFLLGTIADKQGQMAQRENIQSEIAQALALR